MANGPFLPELWAKAAYGRRSAADLVEPSVDHNKAFAEAMVA